MGRIVTILGAQVRPVAFDPGATLAKFEEEVRTATRDFPGADLLVFPELYLTGEDPFSGGDHEGFAEEVAEQIPGPLTERIGKIAAKAKRWIAAGSIVERSDQGLHDTGVVFSPDGELAVRHRKLFPWEPFEQWVAGEGPASVFDIPDAGRLGMMICYDGWFPEVARGLALQGAELILQPTLTTTPDREEELVLARANAITNQVYVINVNAATTVGGGRSIGVDPEGRILFELGQNEELVLEVVDLERVATVREKGTRGLNHVWRHFQKAPPGVFEPYRGLLRD